MKRDEAKRGVGKGQGKGRYDPLDNSPMLGDLVKWLMIQINQQF